MNQNFTGYPSIDKPWLQYYSEEDINSVVPKCSIWQNIYDSNVNHLSDVALLFFGKKITYKELFANVDRVAKAFVANDIACNKSYVNFSENV